MKIFSDKLRYERKLANLTQKEMADKLDIPYNAYKKYELIGTSSGREPSMETIAKIADILNVSVDYLFGRED